MSDPLRTRAWTLALASFSAVLVLTLAMYHATVESLVRIWMGSETFAYCILVAPTSGYLIWLKRRALSAFVPRPVAPALLLLPVLGLVWLASRTTSTILVQQASLVAFVPVLVYAYFGPHITRSIAFPLGFLFFCVPFGDTFRPQLMSITADIAVAALRASGVPVAREGVFLATPNATWRIAEACSGLQFLAAGFVLTCVFAYATFRPAWKRIVCVGVSVGVLILANGFRAYALILMGYLTDMRLGRGPEHPALGYVVYGLALLAYFAACSRFRDRTLGEEPPPDGEPGPNVRPRAAGAWVALAGAAMLTLAPWPQLDAHLSRAGSEEAGAPISAPEPDGGWSLSADPGPNWAPRFEGASSQVAQSYAKDDATVRCYIGFYRRQGEGSKLVRFRSVIARTDDLNWRNTGERERRLRLPGEGFDVHETDVRTRDARVLVWNWYWIPDDFTSSAFWAKLLQARATLTLGRQHAALIVLAASTASDTDPPEDLQRFTRDMLPSIRAALHRADRSR
jgi:exosortase A